ncbi:MULTISPECIES: XdhC family protein [Paracoccus]|uniref:XdhC family protein n=1 Tax=Paracoccus kondratievae TaxID=135740 RepID=A0AAD3RUN4_9RHOB|nr:MULTISPECIES: XdhC family protein [Paracoccus]GLK65115.1 hypothetical protein GCM10017635_25860 [Paracoccus kondratievae]SMG33957.1 xanthine dehydrogenase accessory factor [Paracoccus sp. J56]
MIQDFHISIPVRDQHPALLDPWLAALEFGPGTVMAVLTQTIGPAYKTRGAAMAIAADGRTAGALSSGCIEADLVLHAQKVRQSGIARRLRYGQGSPFMDLRLPCGGGIEVMLFPLHDLAPLETLARRMAARQVTTLTVTKVGTLELGANAGFRLTFRPPLRFVIFGAGAEAAVFADLVRSLGFRHVLLSHEDRSLDMAQAMGCMTRRLGPLPDMAELLPDDRCAALLFYHDHDYEPEILRALLSGPAFYIGAQGSRRTQADRLERLTSMGIPIKQRQRVRGPIGLIPSSRDPRQLAVSVLAEVLMVAGTQDVTAGAPA